MKIQRNSLRNLFSLMTLPFLGGVSWAAPSSIRFNIGQYNCGDYRVNLDSQDSVAKLADGSTFKMDLKRSTLDPDQGPNGIAAFTYSGDFSPDKDNSYRLQGKMNVSAFWANLHFQLAGGDAFLEFDRKGNLEHVQTSKAIFFTDPMTVGGSATFGWQGVIDSKQCKKAE